jgi:hypothetical protein
MRWFNCLGLAFLILSGCNRAPVAVPLTAEDLRAARQAIPLSDVSLMLRSGYKQEAIIAEVRKKHVPAPPDATTEDSLVGSGASPALIAALKAKENLLTENQKQAFDNLAAEKTQRLQQETASRQQDEIAAQQAESNERHKRAYTLQKTLQNAQAAEDKEKAYERAWDAYKKAKGISREPYHEPPDQYQQPARLRLQRRLFGRGEPGAGSFERAVTPPPHARTPVSPGQAVSGRRRTRLLLAEISEGNGR